MTISGLDLNAVPGRTSRDPRPRRRPDIQGLRALAVVLVIAEHTFGWPRGGFVGVDVFFVLSGFLITGLLLREYESTGTISARRFYVARTKRIVPAASLTLLGTVGAAALLFAPQRAWATFGDAVSGFFFAANWRFALDGTDYFSQGGGVSPVQHFWSLSVEEQFYFVWPWVLLALLSLMASRAHATQRRIRWVAGISVGTISVASLAWALVQSTSSPTMAYFSTFTRVWELGLGALLAAVAPYLVVRSARARAFIAWTGIAGILASALVLSSSSVWPAPWALLPTLATCMVIVAGDQEPAPHLGILTNRVSVYIGDISYSLYLWHFPAIIFGAMMLPDTAVSKIAILLLAVGISIMCHHVVERPIWKMPSRHDLKWSQWRLESRSGARAGGLAGSLAIALGIFAAFGAHTPSDAATPAYSADYASDPDSPVGALQVQIQAALEADVWPELRPAPSELGPSARVDAWVEDGCLALELGAEQDPRDTAERCVYGPDDATHSIALLGDSFGISWLPALQRGFPESRIHVMTMQQCPVSDVDVLKGDGTTHDACNGFREWTMNRLLELSPDLVIVAEAENTMFRLVSGLNSDPAAAEVGEGMQRSLARLTSQGLTPVILQSAPLLVSYEECFTPTAGPASCTASPLRAHWLMGDVLADAAKKHSSWYIPTSELFCAKDQCPIQIAGKVARADQGHLTEEYSAHIGEALASRIVAVQGR